jgi:hypothetical protein
VVANSKHRYGYPFHDSGRVQLARSKRSPVRPNASSAVQAAHPVAPPTNTVRPHNGPNHVSGSWREHSVVIRVSRPPSTRPFPDCQGREAVWQLRDAPHKAAPSSGYPSIGCRQSDSIRIYCLFASTRASTKCPPMLCATTTCGPGPWVFHSRQNAPRSEIQVEKSSTWPICGSPSNRPEPPCPRQSIAVTLPSLNGQNGPAFRDISHNDRPDRAGKAAIRALRICLHHHRSTCRPIYPPNPPAIRRSPESFVRITRDGTPYRFRLGFRHGYLLESSDG